MPVSTIYVHTTTALSGSGVSRVLQEGSSVSVRVLSRTGPRSYTVSFAGGRFSVRSDRRLQPGSSFRATVTLRDGKIALVPESAESQTGLIRNFISSEAAQTPQPLTDAGLASYLASLGIQPDTLSYRLVQQLQQLGVRFDAKLLNRIRLLASRFPGHETEAAEAALLLEEKGIESTVGSVSALLWGTSDGSGSPSDYDGAATLLPDESETREDTDIHMVLTALRRYADSVFHQGAVPEKRRPGVLTLFNHMGFHSEHADLPETHWMMLPFELYRTVGDVTKKGQGVMRFFSDVQKKTCRKLILQLQLERQNYFFVLNFSSDGKEFHTVLFSIDPVPADRVRIESALRSFLKDISENPVAVAWLDKKDCSPFFTENIPLASVRGSI